MQWAGVFDEDFPPNFYFGVDLGLTENENFEVPDVDDGGQFDAEIADFIVEGKAKKNCFEGKK